MAAGSGLGAYASRVVAGTCRSLDLYESWKIVNLAGPNMLDGGDIYHRPARLGRGSET